jgi:hypothetical protein
MTTTILETAAVWQQKKKKYDGYSSYMTETIMNTAVA